MSTFNVFVYLCFFVLAIARLWEISSRKSEMKRLQAEAEKRDEQASQEEHKLILLMVEQEYTEIQAKLEPARITAEQGDADAQCQLGLMLTRYSSLTTMKIADEKYGVEDVLNFNIASAEAETEAAQWFRKAAEQEDAGGQYYMGCMYTLGMGVEKNDTEAEIWFRKAAEQEHADAQCRLGEMYAEGKVVEKNDTQAAKWFQKSAERGYAGAQYNLGLMYAAGKGIEKNDTQAAKWLRKAVEQADAMAQYNLRADGPAYLLPVFVLGGDRVKKIKTEAELREEEAFDREWARVTLKTAEEGYAVPQYNLGLIYAAGRGIEKDYTEARIWFENAANQGNADAQCCLGVMFAAGEGVRERDDMEAVKWFHKAAELGFAGAQYNLGLMYAAGRGVERNDTEAAQWFRRAAKQAEDLSRYNACMMRNLWPVYTKGMEIQADLQSRTSLLMRLL